MMRLRNPYFSMLVCIIVIIVLYVGIYCSLFSSEGLLVEFTFNSSSTVNMPQCSTNGLEFALRVLNGYCGTNERHVDTLHKSPYH